MNKWTTVHTDGDGKVLLSRYQTLRGKHWTIYLIPRPSHCVRGNWLAQLHPNMDNPPNHIDPGSYVAESDPWPRYYFDLTRAKLEVEAWLIKRNQRV